MTVGGQVVFNYEWESEDDDELGYLQLSVTAQVSRSYPAIMYLSNGDPGCPAEGGEVENIEVSLPDGSMLDPIPDILYALLKERAALEEVQHDGGF